MHLRPLQAAAEGALTGLQSAVETLRLTLENNRNVMMQELQSFEGIKVTKPDGTYYCLPIQSYNTVGFEDAPLQGTCRHCSGKEFGWKDTCA